MHLIFLCLRHSVSNAACTLRIRRTNCANPLPAASFARPGVYIRTVSVDGDGVRLEFTAAPDLLDDDILQIFTNVMSRRALALKGTF